MARQDPFVLFCSASGYMRHWITKLFVIVVNGNVNRHKNIANELQRIYI